MKPAPEGTGVTSSRFWRKVIFNLKFYTQFNCQEGIMVE